MERGVEEETNYAIDRGDMPRKSSRAENVEEFKQSAPSNEEVGVLPRFPSSSGERRSMGKPL